MVRSTLDKRYANGDFVAVEDKAVCIYRMKNGVFRTVTAS